MVGQDMAREDTGSAVDSPPLARFCARLKRLQQAAGLTQVSLARGAGLRKSQMSAILNGDIKKVPDWNVVKEVVHACLLQANEVGNLVPPDLCDEEEWRRRYFDLEQDLDAAARPGHSARPAAGWTAKTVRQYDPFDLEVHHALLPTGTASPADGPDSLTPYLKRDHDNELNTALHRAAAGGPSVFAVLAGGSCTGKTRALYQGLLEVVPNWPLLRPSDADELVELLQKGRFRAGTVLWLNETQRHLHAASGERAASLLRTALENTHGAMAVGALWPRPYLEELTAVGNSPDVHAAARALLDGPRTHRITVPDCLTAHQRQEFAKLAAADERMGAALEASGPDGDVIQHLTGGPELLHAYTRTGLFTPVEHALITAALDARRLGHQGPIPAALLAAAADGYLSPRQRPSRADWATSALTGLTSGVRADGSRTGIRNALTSLKTVRARSGHAETGYEPDDYLDQHTRQLRQECLGTRQLWDALAEHTTSPADLARLGDAAHSRGLYRHAAVMWKHAVTTTGHIEAAYRLITLLHLLGRDAAHHAANWIAEQAALDDPRDVAWLLGALREAGAGEAVAALASRAAEQAVLDDPGGVAVLLGALREAGAGEAVAALLARHPAEQAALDDPGGVAVLLGALREAGAGEAVAALLARHPAEQAALDDPWGVAGLLRELREAGAGEAVAALLARHPAEQAALDDPGGVAALLGALREAGAGEAVAALASRAAEQAALHVPGDVARLLGELREAGAGEAVAALASRAAEQAALDDPWRVARLLGELREAGEAVAALASRAAAHVSLDNPPAVAWLLGALREAGAQEQVTALAERAAAHVSLDNPPAVASLLGRLREAGAGEAAATLASRATEQAALDHPWRVAALLGALREAGAQISGS